MSHSSDNRKLDPCGCCEPPPLEPRKHSNRPGQLALTYRIGTHSSFLRRMLARLPAQSIPGGPNQGNQPLATLATRNTDDPTVAILDAWATVADVLTFYQERIANEGYLRTATERRSVLELARCIGYELSPGVAAGAYLAFTVEDAPGAPKAVNVPQGTQVQSVPVPPELPQTFETAEEFEARAEWNALKPRSLGPQPLGPDTVELCLDGVSTGLQVGDGILLVGQQRCEDPTSDRWAFRIVNSPTVCPEQSRTRVAWQDPLGDTVCSEDDPLIYALRQRATLCCDVPTPGSTSMISLDAGYPKILVDSWMVLHGYLPPLRGLGNEAIETAPVPTAALYRVEGVYTWPCHKQQVSVPATAVAVSPTPDDSCEFEKDHTAVFAQSEKLEFAEVPLEENTPLDHIELDGLIPSLGPGRFLIVRGRRAWESQQSSPPVSPDELKTESAAGLPSTAFATAPIPQGQRSGSVVAGNSSEIHLVRPAEGFWFRHVAEEDETVAEIVRVERTTLTDDRMRTIIVLQEPLEHSYDPASVTIHANVVRATHGETTSEVLGSGDGSLANQRFQLKKPPLTYVSAPTSSGSQSSLELRVNGLLWQEEPTLYGLASHSEAYIARHQNNGTTRVTFGDGQSGARLPTGMENVTARYRSGIGPGGEVAADSLTLLKTRPFGIREVNNPLPAAGAAGPERLDEARSNAPRTVLTFDRIVSLQDFEDFARGFAGIGKAMAVALWSGESQVVHITVATASGKPLSLNPDLHNDLVASIRQACEPAQRFHVDDYDPQQFCLDAAVKIDTPQHISQDVLAEVEVALSNAYSFQRRELGQAVTAAELATVIHAVPGVIAVQLRQLHLQDDQPGPEHERPPAILLAATAQWNQDKGRFQPAQLLTLMSGGVTLSEMESSR